MPEVKPRTYKETSTALRHKLFIEHLLNDPDRNQTQAYLKTYPNCSYETAKRNSFELLNKTNIHQLITQREQEIQEAIKSKTIITKEKIINDIERISNKAEENEQFSPALKGKELIGKELGMFRDQAIMINDTLENLVKYMNKPTIEDAEILENGEKTRDNTLPDSENEQKSDN